MRIPEEAYWQVDQQLGINFTLQPSTALTSRVRPDDSLDSMRRRFVETRNMRTEQVREKRFLSDARDQLRVRYVCGFERSSLRRRVPLGWIVRRRLLRTTRREERALRAEIPSR